MRGWRYMRGNRNALMARSLPHRGRKRHHRAPARRISSTSRACTARSNVLMADHVLDQCGDQPRTNSWTRRAGSGPLGDRGASPSRFPPECRRSTAGDELVDGEHQPRRPSSMSWASYAMSSAIAPPGLRRSGRGRARVLQGIVVEDGLGDTMGGVAADARPLASIRGRCALQAPPGSQRSG